MIEGILVTGLAAAGFALLFRALPWPAALLASRHWFWRKVWDCSSCAGGRGALAVMFVFFDEWPGLRTGILLWLGATAVGSAVYHWVRPPPIDLALDGLGE